MALSRAALRRLMVPASAFLVLVLVGCGGTTTSSAPTSPAGVASPSPGATGAETFGPTPYSLWVNRQGFGGTSGVRQIAKGSEYLQEHTAAEAAGDLMLWAALPGDLGEWLDQHPPTPCWATYHAAMREALRKVDVDFHEVVVLASAGSSVPTDLTARLAADVAGAEALQAPTNCP
jgi:hypothetical protein